VTIPIEGAVNNTPRLISRRSRTIFGLSILELTFFEGTDDYRRVLSLCTGPDGSDEMTAQNGMRPSWKTRSTSKNEPRKKIGVEPIRISHH